MDVDNDISGGQKGCEKNELEDDFDDSGYDEPEGESDSEVTESVSKSAEKNAKEVISLIRMTTHGVMLHVPNLSLFQLDLHAVPITFSSRAIHLGMRTDTSSCSCLIFS